MKKRGLVFALLAATGMIAGCGNQEEEEYSFQEVKNQKFEHMHGLGYVSGGPGIVIATHDGLYSYEEGWKEAVSEKHDYMGFQATREGFFSSGHPAPGSDYKNPLGLVKSNNKGASFDQLAFYGEIDFHYLGAGYESNAIYVLNEMPINEMSAGLHYSLDEGEAWEKSAMSGFDSEFISNIAVHPKQEEMLVIGSEQGMFLSKDYGNTFEPFGEEIMVPYVTLTNDGGYYSSVVDEKVQLKSFSFTGDQVIDIPLPNENVDPIVYIASNPDDEKELVFATHTNDLYLTSDKGSEWIKLADKGELLK